MLYTPRGSNPRDPDEALYQSLEPVIRGMEMALIELCVFRSKKRGGSRRSIEAKADPAGGRTVDARLPTGNFGSVQVKAVVYREGITGVEDCSRVHRGILPRLELAFPGQDIYLEVSSPGIDRIFKDGREFVHFIGRGVKCYCTDISDWTAGVLCAADENGIVLRAEKKETTLPYEVIAKARLNELT